MSDIKEYKCPSCGAPLKYNMKTQRMECGFCSSVYDLEYIRTHFNDENVEKSDDFDWVERAKNVSEPYERTKLLEYTCPSCGSRILMFTSSVVMRCPFCEHDLIISAKFQGDIRPDKIIPFSKTAKDFADAYWSQATASKYIPKEFRDPDFTKRIVGRYVPIWLYSCSCKADINGSCVSEFNVKDYPVPGIVFDNNAFYEIEPFNYEQAENFTESCLMGFYASKYTIGAENAMKNADAEIEKYCSYANADPANGTVVVEGTNCSISGQRLIYYLVPVWMLQIKYIDGDYTFAMNGQTGEFSGGELFSEYCRLGDIKEKNHKEVKKKFTWFRRIIAIIAALVILALILLSFNSDKLPSDVASFLENSSLGLIINSAKVIIIVYFVLYAICLILTNPFVGNPQINYKLNTRTIKDFIYDEKKTMPDPVSDNMDDKTAE
jgi:DNA-directed RNA polymerase subunit RPC12/RpoP